MSQSTQSPQKKVESVRLSPTCGLQVSKIILGCMSYGKKSWANWVIEDEAEVIKHFEEAYKLGIYTFDTANVYSQRRSEELTGIAIKNLKLPRENIVVLTKVCMPMTDHEEPPFGFVNSGGLSRRHIFASVHKSLKCLQLEYIDVLQCHRFDPNTPVAETMRALHDLVKSGLVRYIGMSSCYAWQFAKMQNYAIQHNLTPFVSMQNFLCAVYREEQREMMPQLIDMGVGSIPWSPLARGFLTRPHSESSTRAETDKNYGNFVGVGDPTQTDALNAINEAVERIAKKRGVSMAQIALAWVLAQPGVTAPIVGSTKIESIRELAEATHIKLTEEEVKEINEPYKPRRIYGHA